MKQNFEYRAQAREKLTGNWQEIIVLSFIYLIVVVACNCMNVGANLWQGDNGSVSILGGLGSVLNLLIAAPLGYVFSILFLDFVRGHNHMNASTMWDMFRGDYTRLLCTSVVVSCIVSVTSIFTLGILGIYFAMAYAMVPFLMRDYPELTWRELLQTSREMMDGHKWDLFLLELSFIGWILLAVITCGIGLLYVVPYMQATQALFYEDLKKETIVEDNEIEDAQVIE